MHREADLGAQLNPLCSTDVVLAVEGFLELVLLEFREGGSFAGLHLERRGWLVSGKSWIIGKST